MDKELILDYLKKYKYYFIIALVLIIILVLYFMNQNNYKKIDGQVKEIESKLFESNQEKEEVLVEEIVLDKIKVDIKGAVVNPGVYELLDDSRVIDVIKASGGILEVADTSTINLSKILTDEMVIIIYTKEEIIELKKEMEKVESEEIKKCICPEIKNEAVIKESITNVEIVNDKEINDSEDSSSNEVSNKININTASMEELMSLSGVGESKASSIIEYKNSNGLFKTIEDLLNVSGIGTSMYENIKDNITV